MQNIYAIIEYLKDMRHDNPDYWHSLICLWFFGITIVGFAVFQLDFKIVKFVEYLVNLA